MSQRGTQSKPARHASCYMKKTPLILVTFCSLLANVCISDNGSAPAEPSPSNDSVVVLPKMTITDKNANPSLRICPHDLNEAAFAKGDLLVGFPAQARFKRVFDGSAAVGVMVDAEGKRAFLCKKELNAFSLYD